MWTLAPRHLNGFHSLAATAPLRGAWLDTLFADERDAASEPRAAKLDIRDTGKAFEVKADLPGVEKSAVSVRIEGKRVQIEASVNAENEKKEGERVVYSERSASKFMRSFVLPVEVDSNAAEAKLENGVLTLTLPKKATVLPKQLTVS